MTSKERKGVLTVFVYTLLVIMTLTLPLNVSVKEAKAQETPTTPSTKIEIVLSEITIGEIGKSLPTPLTTINVTVTNVTDLYAWQIRIYFDESILKFEGATAATIPMDGNVVNDPYNIFHGKPLLKVSSIVMADPGTTDYYVLYGAVLLGDVPGVNGSGVLCQLNFKGVSSGTSSLNFARPYGLGNTYLLNSTKTETGSAGSMQIIPSDLVDATVNVLGEGISINVRPEVLEVEERANITGFISPPQITTVTIYYRPNGTDEMSTLGTNQTFRVDLNETYYETHYIYIWKPDKDGVYELKAEGGLPSGGGEIFKSQIKMVTVNPKPVAQQVGIELYGPFAGVVVVSAVTFFVWDRRRRRSGRIILP